jgi:hypothetical protein
MLRVSDEVQERGEAVTGAEDVPHEPQRNKVTLGEAPGCAAYVRGSAAGRNPRLRTSLSNCLHDSLAIPVTLSTWSV